MQARRHKIRVLYDENDISEDIAPFVKSFTFEEKVSDEADSAAITLHDRDNLFIADWFPTKASILRISIVRIDENGEESLDLGQFEVDTVENTLSPSECKLKLVSIPNSSELRATDKSRSWEKIPLSKIAKDIADNAHLELFFQTVEDPIIDRVEQDGESDLSFLKKLCKKSGCALKITDSQLIIFDVEDCEKRDIVATISKDSGKIKQFNLKTKTIEVYKSCEISYQHGIKSELITAEFQDPSKSSGKRLKIREKVETQAEAERLARKRLREKNSEETTGNFTMIGDFSLLSGNTVEISGFGIYDGKYLISRSTHDLSNGYTTRIEIKKTLEGY